MARNDERYASVNALTYPPITRKAAYVIARKLLAKLGSPKLCAVQGIDDETGEPMLPARMVLDVIFARWVGEHGFRKVRKLGRTCWASTRETTGADKGWGRIVHDVSHMLQEYRHPGERPHGGSHPGIEREVADVALTLLAEVTARKPRKLDSTQRRSLRMMRAQEKLIAWTRKRNRAENAIKKLKRQLAAMNRSQAKALNLDHTHATAGEWPRDVLDNGHGGMQ